MKLVGLPVRAREVECLPGLEALKPNTERQAVRIAEFLSEFNRLQCVGRMVEVHHELFGRRNPLQKLRERFPFRFNVCRSKVREGRRFAARGERFAPPRPEGGFINPVVGETERQASEFAEKEIPERFIAVDVDRKALGLFFRREVGLLRPCHADGG